MKQSLIVNHEHAADALGIAKMAQRLIVWGMMTKRQAAAFEAELLACAPCDVTVAMRQRKGQAHVTLEGVVSRTYRIKPTGDVLSP